MLAHRDALAKFYQAALGWAAGERCQGVVDAAAQALVDDLDTPSLRYLAGATQASADADANEWVPKAIEELGLRLPDRNSTEAKVAAARLMALRFLRDPSDPRSIAKMLYRMYVDTEYASELADFSGHDDWYDLLDTGVVAGDPAEVDRAVAQSLAELAANHLATSIPLGRDWALSEAGVVFPSWSGAEEDLRSRTRAPSASANARLLAAMPEDWRTRVVARTSMHDLLFTHPVDEFPFPRSVRVSWEDGVYSMELSTEVGVVTGDKCYESTAPAVLSSLLAQLVGGETPPTSPLTVSAQLVDQRLRNRVIEYLELASSFKEQRRYQRRVRIAHVPHEVINQWEDYVGAKRRYPTVCSAEEVEALKTFDAVWERVTASTPRILPSIREVQKLPAWAELRDAAAEALRVLERRGLMPEDRELPPITNSDEPSPPAISN